MVQDLIQTYAMRAVVWLATAAIGAAFAIRRYLRRFGGLDSVVSFSARLIAAARAWESGRSDAFVKDPLAAILAGRQAMQQRKAYSKRNPAPIDDGVVRPVGRIVMRTVFFDHTIQAAVAQDAQQLLPPAFLEGLRTAMGGGSCTQVVLLGSGLDSRPWRLALPAGVAWFEVDRADVLRAKRRLLQRAGATFEPAPEQASGEKPASYPLRCASWAGVSLDLQEPGWTKQLTAGGFKASQPTVWVLEGLLYYLAPETVPALLKEAASVSAPGSVLVASIVSAELVARILSRPKRGGSIMDAWQWGCPEEPAQYFGACGWRVLGCPTWEEVARAYGWQPEPSARRAAAASDRATDDASSASNGSDKRARESSVRYLTAVLRVQASGQVGDEGQQGVLIGGGESA